MTILLLLATLDVRPHGLFTDHMVLQRDVPAPVWGTAEAGTRVEVALAGRRKSAVADADGRWKLALDPMPAGGPYELAIGPRVLRDVWVGEVWLCSGQSNMAWPVRLSAEPEREIAAAKHPRIRFFTVPQRVSDAPQMDVEGAWRVCDPGTIATFSAVAYHFARELRETEDVAFGLIHAAVGATRAQAWVSPAALATVPKFQPVPNDPIPSSGLYHGMIAPLIPYATRGTIWYQGEGNVGSPFVYRDLFPALIRSWREAWGRGDTPFLYVQLAGHLKRREPGAESYWAYLRESQAAALALPKTGMATAVDIGDELDIHPKNKREVGRRLALAARAIAYGKKDVVFSGPVFESLRLDGSALRVSFRHAGGGLLAKGGAPKGFALAGADQRCVWAEAKIEGEHVRVWSPEVPKPLELRYAWADNPEGTLTNREGLPALPFRTTAP